MPFVRGQKKTGGRKKGSVNKWKSVAILCETSDVNPFQVMIDIIQTTKRSSLRLAAAKELCQYLEPKKKSIEHSGEIRNPYANLTLEELRSLGKKRLELPF